MAVRFTDYLDEESDRSTETVMGDIEFFDHQLTAIQKAINMESFRTVSFTEAQYKHMCKIHSKYPKINKLCTYDELHALIKKSKKKSINDIFDEFGMYYDEKCKTVDMFTNYGIIADKVASGKTLISYGIISALKNRKPKDEKKLRKRMTLHKGYHLNGNLRPYYSSKGSFIPCSMIISPATLYTQWESEGEKTGLKIYKVQSMKQVIRFCNKNIFFSNFKNDAKSNPRFIEGVDVEQLFSINKKEKDYNTTTDMTEDYFYAFQMNKVEKEKEDLIAQLKDGKISQKLYDEEMETRNNIFVESDLDILYENGFTREELNPLTVWIKVRFNGKIFKKIIAEYDVFLINNYFYRHFMKHVKDIIWERIFFEEAHAAEIAGSVQNKEYELPCLNSIFFWLITATPEGFKSNKDYIKNNFVGSFGEKVKGKLCELISQKHMIINKTEFVQRSIRILDPFYYVLIAQAEVIIEHLNKHFNKDVINAINALDYEKARQTLKCDIDTKDGIILGMRNKANETIKLIMGQRLQLLRPCITKESWDQPETYDENGKVIPKKYDYYEDKLAKLKQTAEWRNLDQKFASVQEKFQDIKETIANLENTKCLVCLSIPTTYMKTKCCSKLFCPSCIGVQASKNNLCPMCRLPLTPESLTIIDCRDDRPTQKEEKVVKNIFSKLGKSDALDKLISLICKTNKKPRIIIFAENSSTLREIERAASNHNLGVSTPPNVSYEMKKMMSGFENGSINILLLAAENFGAGLNMQMAEYIIVTHRMSEDMETQIIGRGQRPGRTTNLKIIYLVTDKFENTVTNNKCKKLNHYEDVIKMCNRHKEGEIEPVPTEYMDVVSEDELQISDSYEDEEVEMYDSEEERPVKKIIRVKKN